MLEPEDTSPLTIRLLGPFDVQLQGAPLPRLRSRKGQWLLALLALHHDVTLERAWLARTLWPDSDQDDALASLRQTLADLRRALGPQADRLACPTPRTLRLDPSGARADVVSFDQAVRGADAASLESAVALYRGPLLESCAEEWAAPERERREQHYLAALQALAQRATERRQPTTAVAYLRRAVAVDPLQETAQRALMRALVEGGEQAAVAQVYRDLRRSLRDQFQNSVEPDPETSALYHSLQAQARRRAQRPLAAPKTLSPPPPRVLPQPLTALVGREREVEEVLYRLLSARLVTLTGAGGMGKTRLAIRVAEAAADGHPDGAWFVDLGALTNPAQVPQAVAGVVGAREEGDRPLTQTLANFLKHKQLLLVLDNCEHLLPDCAVLAAGLLEAASGVRILATSRQRLGITGEVVRRVSPLALPEVEAISPQGGDPAPIVAAAAVQLFAQQAQAVQPGFTITVDNAPAVARICQQLDGIPLAIELAAARMGALPLDVIARRLDDRFRLLQGADPSKPQRHRTLQAALDWSYDLLVDEEQTLLRRVSVFAGDWDLEAAEAVCAEPGVAPDVTVDVLGRLVEQSLVMFELGADGAGRYRLLETIRDYARGRSTEAERASVRRRHAEYFLALAEEAEPQLKGPASVRWLERLEAEQDNFRTAFLWSHHQDDPEVDLRLAAALGHFWDVKGHWTEGRRWLMQALERGASARPALRAKAMKAAGHLACQQADWATAHALHAQSLNIWRELGDGQGVAGSLNDLANVLRLQGNYGLAQAQYEESLARYQNLGNRRGVAMALHNLGTLAHSQGDFVRARAWHEESLALYRELGDEQGIAAALGSSALVAYDQGDLVMARARDEESLAIRRKRGDKAGVALSLTNLGNVACSQGDLAAAQARHEESLALWRELGDRRRVGYALSNLGNVAWDQGDHASARALHEEGLAVQRAIHNQRGIAVALDNLATLAYQQADHPSARALYRECLALLQALGDKHGIAIALESLAWVSGAQGRPATTARLMGVAEALREAIQTRLAPDQRADHQRHRAGARAALGEMFAAAWDEGRAMTLPDAIACALEENGA